MPTINVSDELKPARGIINGLIIVLIGLWLPIITLILWLVYT